MKKKSVRKKKQPDPDIENLKVNKADLKLEKEEMGRLWAQIKIAHSNKLKPHGVRLPQDRTLHSQNYSGKQIQLCLLLKFMGKLVSRNFASDVIRMINDTLGPDQQSRHNGAQHGFNVLVAGDIIPGLDNKRVPSGFNMLVNLDEPKPGFQPEKRDGIKRHIYPAGTPCKHCEAIAGQPHPKNPCCLTNVVDGHGDPAGALLNDNLVPLCQFCNRSAKDDYIFKSNGRIHAFNKSKRAIKLLEHAPVNVQTETLQWLEAKLKQTDSKK